MTTENQEFQNDSVRESAVDLEACVIRLETAIFKGMMEEAAPFGLNHVEFSLLNACIQRNECTATELASVLPVDASRISRVVNTLVDMGMLRRRRLRSDRRTVMLSLTEEGSELAQRLHERMREYYAKLVDGVSTEELRVLESTTTKILANYDAMKDSPTP